MHKSTNSSCVLFLKPASPYFRPTEMILRICLVLVLISRSDGFLCRKVFDGRAKLHPVFQIPKRVLFRRFSSQNEADWKVGDVYRDLDALEYAINLENAEENLQQAKRLEMLDYCAQQRREISSDFKRFVCFPLASSLLLRISSRNSYVQVLIHSMTRCADLHFWLVVVSAPLLLLVAKMILKPKPDSMPEELKRLDPEYLKFLVTNWVDPETCCQDYVQFLLEYWASAVIGVALMGTALSLKLFPSTTAVRFWISLVQPIARLGAVASLHQFQGPLFELFRTQKPKPIGFFPTTMRFLVSFTFTATPLAIAFEVTRAFLHFGWDSLLALHMSIVILSIGTVVRMNQKGRDGFQKLEKRSLGGKVAHAFAAFAFWKKPFDNLRQSFRYYQISFPQGLKHWVVLAASSSVCLLAFLRYSSSSPNSLGRVSCRCSRIYSKVLGFIFSCCSNNSVLFTPMIYHCRLVPRCSRDNYETRQKWNKG